MSQKEHNISEHFSQNLGVIVMSPIISQLPNTHRDLDSDHSNTSVFKELLAYLRRKNNNAILCNNN